MRLISPDHFLITSEPSCGCGCALVRAGGQRADARQKTHQRHTCDTCKYMRNKRIHGESVFGSRSNGRESKQTACLVSSSLPNPKISFPSRTPNTPWDLLHRKRSRHDDDDDVVDEAQRLPMYSYDTATANGAARARPRKRDQHVCLQTLQNTPLAYLLSE